jgi:predicted ATPase
MPHHRTLQATLAWSYELLTESERVVLRRLTIFAGGFTLDAASTVAADDDIAAPEVLDFVANLIAKSLVTTEASGPRVRHRLLETTRAYGSEKLLQAAEFEAVAHRHAERYRALFDAAEAAAETQPDEWLTDYRPHIDNVRRRSTGVFARRGHLDRLGADCGRCSLVDASVLMEECRGRVERALSAIVAGASRDARREMKVHAALAT